MVRAEVENLNQGDIISINLDPTKGHEQAGTRPALVISNNYFNKKCKMAIVCPITSKTKPFPLHIKIEGEYNTKGYILCQHLKSIDVNARECYFVERIKTDLLNEVIDCVYGAIEVS